MRPLRWLRTCGGRLPNRWHRGRHGLELRIHVATDVGDAPDAPVLIISHIQRAIRAYRQTRGSMRGLARLLVGTGEVIGENDVLAGGLAVRQRLIHEVISALGEWRTIPRPVKRDERAALVGRGKLA